MTGKLQQLPFSETTRRWFETHFPAATEVQRRGWDLISQGHHSLLLAPTGSGKTLAAFLWTIRSDQYDDDKGNASRILLDD